MKTIFPLVTALSITAVMGPLVVAADTGCTAAQGAPWTNVEQTVLTDLTDGKLLAQIETDVAVLLPVGADINLVINAAIAFLHEANLLPPNILPVAASMQAEALHKSTMKKAAVTP